MRASDFIFKHLSALILNVLLVKYTRVMFDIVIPIFKK